MATEKGGRLSQQTPLLRAKPTIRPAVSADVSSICAIFRHYVENTTTTLKKTVSDPANLAKYLKVCKEWKTPFLVAVTSAPETKEDRRKVIGYCFTIPSELSDKTKQHSHVAELHVFCDPLVVGNGVGQLLMQDTVAKLRGERMYDELEVSIPVPALDRDAQKQRTAFERIGFREIERVKDIGEKDGTKVDVLYMRLYLQGGGA
ncbi:hypothetical protein MMC09_005944 [Bachmanniomyces sp. S44760]|nr:hypothetical protein [Bachmanniomyces sp. S44760]